jgi:hypothetical protein
MNGNNDERQQRRMATMIEGDDNEWRLQRMVMAMATDGDYNSDGHFNRRYRGQQQCCKTIRVCKFYNGGV